jgi:hypothetical protein
MPIPELFFQVFLLFRGWLANGRSVLDPQNKNIQNNNITGPKETQALGRWFPTSPASRDPQG